MEQRQQLSNKNSLVNDTSTFIELKKAKLAKKSKKQKICNENNVKMNEMGK